MSAPNEGTRLLGIRRVGSDGFGTAVAIRAQRGVFSRSARWRSR